MASASDLLTLARRELGVTEDPKGSNRVKYNTAYYGREVSGDSYPWCCVFLWWLFRKAGAAELFYDGDRTASFMHATRTGGAVRGDGFVRAALPLKNAGSMVFILPDEGVGLHGLLGSVGLEALLGGGENVYSIIDWSVPKFGFDSSFDLVPMLRALGVTAAFEADAALDGIHPDAFVSGVQQQTHIGVDEKGVEAAAFTRIDVAGAADVEPPRVDMALDRPFLYAVTAANGALLFIGVVGNPAA